jgi:predicted RNA binding protein YcfA (HicA-like mRNA interferase family)
MMGSGLYAELSKRLCGAGCQPTRQGKGSHEIWLNPKSGVSFTVPHSIKSRHTANEILKQAGLPKAF